MSSTNYSANAVACKLWGLVGSPTEFILALTVYRAFARSYEVWTPWVYSNEEYQQSVAEGGPSQIGLFALVPQLQVNQVGDVDLAIFVPGRNKYRPVVAVETDGHQFHERTVDQASNDRRRDRILQRSRVPVFRFTGTDVVRSSEECAHEIIDYVNERAQLSAWRTQ
jgi:Protein of unknown function (DUF559)